MIDTPGLNDSNGEEQDKKNINLMKDYIKNHNRIKGIIILLKFTDNRITGSIKKSLDIFCDMLPMNYFWSHVVIVFSHYFANNIEAKKKKKNYCSKNMVLNFLK